MRKVHLLSISIILISISLFTSCSDDYGDTSAPIKWTSSTHTIRMENKYTHQVFLDASADTIQFDCVNYSYPYITTFSSPDGTYEYRIGVSSDKDEPGKESYYFVDTHEQHIVSPNIKVDLKDSKMSVVIAENTGDEQKIYTLAINDSQGGYPAVGVIHVIQPGRK